MCSSHHTKPTSAKLLSCSFLEGTSPRSIPPRSDRTRKDMRTVAILVVTCLWCPPLAHGQSIATGADAAQARQYHLLRQDDDWRFLADDRQRQELWDPIKYIRLRQERNDWFLSMGGEARGTRERIENDNWGQQPFANGFLNQRYMFHVDVHYGEHVRSFVELN